MNWYYYYLGWNRLGMEEFGKIRPLECTSLETTEP
jgi:hypothetical protein